MVTEIKCNVRSGPSTAYAVVGGMEAGQVVMLENANEEDTSPKITAKAYKMEEAVLEQAIGILSENYLEDVTFDTTHINGHLALEKPGRLRVRALVV